MVWFSDNTITIDNIVNWYLSGMRTEPLNIGDGMDDEKKQMAVQARPCLYLVFPLPLWLRRRLCLVCSTAFVAKTGACPRGPQVKCADILAKSITGEGSILSAALEETPKHFTIMEFVPMQCCTAYFALLNMGVQKVLDYNGQNDEFP